MDSDPIMKPVRIVLVEDDADYIEVMRQVLAGQEGYELVRAFRSSLSFLGELPDLDCDLVLLDINLPRLSGLECIGQIRQFGPRMKVLMLTVHDEDEFVLKAFLDGADGYLLKESTPQQILEAMEDALKGGAPLTDSVARKVISVLNQQPIRTPAPAGSTEVERKLTQREYEILQLLAEGRKYGEIATDLGVSLDTVKTHIRNIYTKLQVRNKAEAISRFLKP